MSGLEFETARDTALIVVVVVLGLTVAAAWIVKSIVVKLVAVVVLVAFAAVVWSQRELLADCADRVGATLPAGAVDETTCTFFGRDVSIAAPLAD